MSDWPKFNALRHPCAVPGLLASVEPSEKTRHRTIWLSDVHMGMRDCKAEFLYEFLLHNDADTLYLVGDVLDLWKLRRNWQWKEINDGVIRAILDKARNGTRVIYIPGNHDELLRDYVGTSYEGVEIHPHFIHTGADGKRYLVLHGDEFDSVVKHNKWLALIGNEAYDLLLRLNRYFNFLRRRLGFPYWSLSLFLKHKVKNAVKYICNYEEAVRREANKYQVDGVVCAHIHNAALYEMDGLTYGNTGDWVESCTALVENDDGELELLFWTDRRQDFISLPKVARNEDRHRDGRLATAG